MKQNGTHREIQVNVSGRQLARNTLLNLAGRIVPLLVSVLTIPYVIHHLGPDRYGLLSLAWIVVGYFAVVNLGLGPATAKFVAEFLGKGETDKLPELVWTAFASQLCFGLAGGVLLAILSPVLVSRVLKIPPELHAQAQWIFLILAVALPIDFGRGSLRGVLAASQRFDLLNALDIPFSILTYLVPVAALALGFGLPAIVFFLALARLAGFVVVLVLCVRLYPALSSGFRFNRRLIRSLLGFGGWVTVSGAVTPILAYFDRFLIGAVVSIAAVGFYTPPYMISTKLWILPTSFTATLFPAFAASAGRGDREWISSALTRSLKVLLLLVGPAALVLAFFARPILTLWLGARFAAEGSLALQIMAVAALVKSLAFVPYDLLHGVGRPDIPAKFRLMEAPLYVGLAWFMVTHFGLPGAALAWAIRVAADFLLLIGAACWVTRTSPRLFARRDLGRSIGSLAALAVSLAAVWISTHVFMTEVLFTLLLGCGFLLAVWHYALDLEEKWQIRSWLRAAP
ncbi:MAG: flippase [Acidobacteriota bacterium]